VRQQLLQLQREGWIEAVPPRGDRLRTGRPAAMYRISAAGDHLFPKHYDALAISLVDALLAELGPDAVERVLARVTEQRVAAMEPAVRDLPLEQRVEAMKSWYLEDDPYMTAQHREDGDWLLVERNCPFLNTAMGRPALCSVTTNALTRLLGVRVERAETFQKGDGRCVFRIRPDQPVNADTWKFALE
jgi:predicted ArsR family transcriptional regulator